MNNKKLYESIMRSVSKEVKKALNEMSPEIYRKAADIDDERRNDPEYLKSISGYKYKQTIGRSDKFRQHAKNMEMQDKLELLNVSFVPKKLKFIFHDGSFTTDEAYSKYDDGASLTPITVYDIQYLHSLNKQEPFTYVSLVIYNDTTRSDKFAIDMVWAYDIDINGDDITLYCVDADNFNEYRKDPKIMEMIEKTSRPYHCEYFSKTNYSISDFKYDINKDTYTIQLSMKKNMPLIAVNAYANLNMNMLIYGDMPEIYRLLGDEPYALAYGDAAIQYYRIKKGSSNIDGIDTAYAIYNDGVDGAWMEEIHNEKDIKVNKANNIYLVFDDEELAEELVDEAQQIGNAYSGDYNNRHDYESRHVDDAYKHLQEFIKSHDDIYIYK